MSNYRIGVDVGGTNTDAVLLDEQMNVIAETKRKTEADVSQSIALSLSEVVNQVNIPRDQITHAMLGTTHCTNAIVERKNLNKVGIIRIGAPASLAVEPLIGFPEDLQQLMGDQVFVVQGGHEFDGREIVPLDEDSIVEAAEKMKEHVDSVAITSIFSPVTQAHEKRAVEIVQDVLGAAIPVSLSSEIGSVGLIERENATILNAAVVNVAKSMAEGFIAAVKAEGISCEVYFGQNDGTLMSLDYAMKYPIYTIACGPTNSLRGASYLANIENGIVLDVGGTTADLGVLVDTFPRESALAVEIGEVRTNFRMPDLVSIGLGGGTIIRVQEDGTFEIGPDSVGYRLTEKALVFGGDTLTTTDIAVALGKADIGEKKHVEHLDKKLVEKIYAEMVDMAEKAIDQMKTSQEPEPVILVGGGSILFPNELAGASTVIKPENFGVANAIGSAISQVSGQVERIYSLDQTGRAEALKEAKQLALDEAIAAGADPATCNIVDVEDVPLAYLPGNATRIRVKAAGDLKK
ncbi:hydantoinase/oxoprolinase N-terminal domain-containing protein [Virgibacillus oceani]